MNREAGEEPAFFFYCGYLCPVSQSLKTALLRLHLAVLLWGFTAVLGKLISYGSFNLVWHRMFLTTLFYLFMPAVWRGFRTLNSKHLTVFAGIGVLIALHWVTFYGSIKIGNSVSLALGCFGAVSFFAALLEPLIIRTPFRRQELMLGLLVLVGLALIYQARPQETVAAEQFVAAAGVGIISAFLAALFSVLNKKYLSTHSTLSVSTLELGSGFLFLSLLLPWLVDSSFVWVPEGLDILWDILLALVCTNLAFFLGTDALKHVSAFTANLAVNLEPVYGILFAAFLFKEYEVLNLWFYAGAAVILASVVLQPLLQKYGKH